MSRKIRNKKEASSMKIYFAGSIRGGRQDKELYEQLIGYCRRYGDVLTEHIGDQTLSALGDDGPNDEYIYNRDMKWLAEADVVIAEVTQPSLGVGYEIGWAEGKKPILCLYRAKPGVRPSAMLSGNQIIRFEAYVDSSVAKSKIDSFLLDYGD